MHKKTSTPPVDRRQHLFGRCVTNAPETQFDIGAFAERLLTFERYTIQTRNCEEVRDIVNLLGIDVTQDLFERGTLALYDNVEAIGSIAGPFQNEPALPPLHYRLRHVSLAARKPRPQTARENIFRLTFPGVRHRPAQRLKALLADTVETQLCLGDVISSTKIDLFQRADLLRAAVAEQVKRGTYPGLGEFHISIEESLAGEDALRVVTDIPERLGLSPATTHPLLERAIVAVAGVNTQLAYMAAHDAVTSLPNEDLSFFRMKVDSTVREHSGALGSQLSRILDIAGLPDIRAVADSGSVDFQRLVTIRESDEAREFRAWLRTADTLSEAELAKMLQGFRLRLAPALSSWEAKVLTIVIVSLASVPFNPAMGLLASVGSGLIQTFVLDKLLKAPGPALFVHGQVRSVFDQEKL